MSKKPWFPFYASDWLAGAAALTVAERGVYVTLLAMIYDHGGPIERDDGRLARACGLPTPGFSRALAALLRLGKLTEEGSSFLFNERARAEFARREILRAKWRKGASITNKKSDINDRTPEAKYVAHELHISERREPESDVVSEAETPTKSSDDFRPSDRPSDRYSDRYSDASRARVHNHSQISLFADAQRETRASFARFWSVWPNKVQKPYAEKCFAKVAVEVDAIVTGVERYVRDKPADRPWLNPSTFLNQRRWEDVPAPAATKKGNPYVEAGRRNEERIAAWQRERELRAGAGGDAGDPVVQLIPGFRG